MKKLFIILGAFFLLPLIGMFVVMISPKSLQDQWAKESRAKDSIQHVADSIALYKENNTATDSKAYLKSVEYMKLFLLVEKHHSMKFSDYNNETLYHLVYNHKKWDSISYRVKGYVDSNDEYGMRVRTLYTVDLKFIGKGKWEFINIEPIRLKLKE